MSDKTEIKEDEYFCSYTDLEVHRLMLSDQPRTKAYQDAIEGNPDVFKDKVVMDVGAGTGILSMFCARAGAKRVYAVEASRTAVQLTEVVKLNKLDDVIKVIYSRVEDVTLDEKVDIIVSEWMGFYLLHESMLDSVLIARDHHLKEDGIMLPSHATIFVAPCSLQNFIKERADFWDSVYGFDMTPFKEVVLERQGNLCEPELMCLEADQLLSEPQVVAEFDLSRVQLEDLASVAKRSFVSVTRDGRLQGIALWFDVTFSPKSDRDGSAILKNEVVLKTGPFSPATHWKQTVLVLPKRKPQEEEVPDESGDVTPEMIDEELVEVDDVIGWEVTLTKSDGDSKRQYVIEASVLDPASDEHPFPCGCMSARCALIQAFADQVEDEENDEDLMSV